MINRKMQIFIVLAAIIVVATIVPSKIKDMILLGGSEADDIFLNLIGTVASLFTLLAAIDIKKRLDAHTSDKTVSDINQLDTVGKLRNSNSYNQFNLEVKQVLKNLPKFLVDHIVVSISLLVTIITLFIVHFNDIACHFYGITKDANGQLLTVLLTAIGGGAVIYGLWLNNKRIKEQTEHNNIARTQAETAKKQADIVVSNNNDKRFGEAIGYLGSDNSSIILGGIYSLHQLAKEDSRYISLVNNLYSGYLKDKSSQFYTDERYKTKPPIVIQAIIDIYFNDNSIFKEEQIDLSYTTLETVTFNGEVHDCSFERTVLTYCEFNKALNHCNFNSAKIDDCNFNKTLSYCLFNFSSLNQCTFKDEEAQMLLSNCEFIMPSIKNVRFEGNCINDMLFHIDTGRLCVFKIGKIVDSLITWFKGEGLDLTECELINTHYGIIEDVKESALVDTE